MATNRTLVTGYGPFLNVTENPTTILARESGRPHQVLEVAFEAADEFLASVDPNSFDRLVMLGVAKGRPKINPELFARNHIGNAKDVRGNDRFGLIDPEQPLLLASTLWTAEVIAAMYPRPVAASYDAGSYLCNYLSFRALCCFPQKRVGFLHVPHHDDMPLDRQAEVIRGLLDRIEQG